MRMDVDRGEGNEDRNGGGLIMLTWTSGRRDCRARRNKTGLCGENLSDTSTPRNPRIADDLPKTCFRPTWSTETKHIELRRTCNLEGGVTTDHANPRLRIGRLAVVRPDIRLIVLIMYDSQEEQLAAREEDVVRRRIHGRCLDGFAVTIPCDLGRGFARRHAVQGRGLLLRDILVLGVFDDARVRYLFHACGGRNKSFVDSLDQKLMHDSHAYSNAHIYNYEHVLLVKLLHWTLMIIDN